MKFLRLLLILVVLSSNTTRRYVDSFFIERSKQKEMKALGMKISADDIYSVNNSSPKDAVPHFDGGCTAK